MKEQITLSGREILHIIGLLGKDDFFGIGDDYMNMDDIEIVQAIADAENSLLQKGYAELDFNNNFSVEKRISDILLICVDCEKMLDVEISCVNRKKIKKTIYSKDGKLVEFEKDKNSEYSIAYSCMEDVKSDIMSNLAWIKGREAVPERYFFTQRVLRDAKQALGFGTEEQLVRTCKSTETAKVIANGLNGNSNYYSFALFDFEKENVEISSLMILNSADGSLEMKPEEEREKGTYAFKPVDYDAVISKIEETLTKFGKEGKLE